MTRLMRDEEGSVLLFATIIVAILMGMTIVLTQNSIGEGMGVDGALDGAVSQSVAESALEYTLKKIDVTDITTAHVGTASWDPLNDDDNSNGWPDMGEPNTAPVIMGQGTFLTYAKSVVDADDSDISYVTVRALGGCSSHMKHAGANIVSILETVIKAEQTVTPLNALVPGAVSLVCGTTEEGDYPGTLTCNMHGHPSINGYDHDVDGNLIGDGSGVSGLAVNDGTGDPEWDVNQWGVPADIYGPGPIIVQDGNDYAINNDAAWTGTQLQEVVTAAIANADYHYNVAGGDELRESGGSIGSPDEYAVVHVDVGTEDETAVWLSGNFEGHGLLIITADGYHSHPLIDMQGSASWTGMVIFVLGNDTEIDQGTGNARGAIDLRGGGGQENMILGGMAFLASDGVGVENGGALIDIRGNPDIHYSSSAVANAVNAAGLNNITITVTRLFAFYKVR